MPEWEWETTSRQLARILQLHEKNALPPIAKEVLNEFLGERKAGLESLLKGKIGLALSGGGFRASLFHIGLLAKLAELDLLRDVEYLSCVSGGSIVGAHYYLEVRNLLQCKSDEDIKREDYIKIVERVQNDFLVGVQTNIRVGVLSEWMTNLKMILSAKYSRTNRLGELYEEKIFSRVKLPDKCILSDECVLKKESSPTQPGKLFLDELTICPKNKDKDKDFSPKDQNWRRAAKIPILVLNATPLNTGHNWQFTTTWMGEPPAGAGSAVDANYRLRRMYYEGAPEPHKKIRLGYAVAASSAVPGLFEPLPLEGLYPDKTVRLVDGGVHDNQGTSALLEQGCNVLLVSDASGQMDAQDEPSKGVLAVPLRCNSILQARLRESQYNGLDARRHSGLLQGLLFIHLKQGLEGQPVDWEGCQDPSDPVSNSSLLPYGIYRKIQEKLAAIRTDLDSFSEVEAYALMTSAYRMTEYAFQNSVPPLGFTTNGVDVAPPWKFLEITDEMCRQEEDTPLLRQLAVSDQMFLKIWFLSKPLRVVGAVLLITLLVSLACLGYRWWSVPVPTTLGQIVTALFVMVLSATAWKWKPLMKLLRIRKTAQEIFIGFGMVSVGTFLAKLHLNVFDKWFLRQGSLARLLGKK
ncbi:NTE family protein [Gammaproteobacteria bacterium]